MYPNEKLKVNIEKVEEALKEQELEEEDEFEDVSNCGLLVYKKLCDQLYEYQKEGVAFLYVTYKDQKKGCILADDMGLGKTIQIIGFLSGMFDSEYIKSVLLIVPTTLIKNWKTEFSKWTPGMKVKEFYGTKKMERTSNLERIKTSGGVIITTYRMLMNNCPQLSSFKGTEFVWDYIILDEAHKIKTSSAKTTMCVHCIPAKNRILLTGTPVQNNLREMWSLFDYACQGTLLGTLKTFKMEYENPITRAREKDATPGEKALGLKISENLMEIIKPYFLRRTKEEVLKNKSTEKETEQGDSNQTFTCAPVIPSLPRKNDFVVWVYLGPVQEELYRKVLSSERIKELLITSRSPLAELTILKELCDHPMLLTAEACIKLGLERHDQYTSYNESEESGYLEAPNTDNISVDNIIQQSGKSIFLIGLLERLRDEGHQTLLFSQSRKMLDILDHILTNKGFKIMRIDGTVSYIAERERRITTFQSNKDYSVFLLTTQVGGVGLTLTAADRVVIFDPSWNPATDAQAVDRVYRIGQKENVVIYRLITCGTVEEKIYRRQVFKDSLIRQTTGDKKNPFRYFTRDERRDLFSFDDTRTSTTQIQLQCMHAAQRRTDTYLEEHIAYLYTLEMFGISDHDLMYTSEPAPHEDHDVNGEEDHYIQQRVQKAQELVQLESQMNEQLIEQIKSGTEGAWLRQSVVSSQPVFASKPNERKFPSREFNPNKQYISPPVMDDFTQDVANVCCQMSSLVIEDSDEEMVTHNLSNLDKSIIQKSENNDINKQSNEHDFQFVPSSTNPSLVHDKNGTEIQSANSKGDNSCKAGISSYCVYSNNKTTSRHWPHETDVNEHFCTIDKLEPVIGGHPMDISIPCNVPVLQNNLKTTHTSETLQSASTTKLPQNSFNVMEEFKSDLSDATLEDKEVGLGGDILKFEFQFQSDFKLILEDTAEHIEDNPDFHLRIEESLCESVENSLVRENCIKSYSKDDDIGKNLENSKLTSDSEEVEDEDHIFLPKKENVIMASDDENESKSLFTWEEKIHKKEFSALKTPLCKSLIHASTPKHYITDGLLSSRQSIGVNRSTASRTSLLYNALEDLCDVEVIFETNSKQSDEEILVSEHSEPEGDDEEDVSTGKTNAEDDRYQEESIQTEETAERIECLKGMTYKHDVLIGKTVCDANNKEFNHKYVDDHKRGVGEQITPERETSTYRTGQINSESLLKIGRSHKRTLKCILQ